MADMARVEIAMHAGPPERGIARHIGDHLHAIVVPRLVGEHWDSWVPVTFDCYSGTSYVKSGIDFVDLSKSSTMRIINRPPLDERFPSPADVWETSGIAQEFHGTGAEYVDAASGTSSGAHACVLKHIAGPLFAAVIPGLGAHDSSLWRPFRAPCGSKGFAKAGVDVVRIPSSPAIRLSRMHGITHQVDQRE